MPGQVTILDRVQSALKSLLIAALVISGIFLALWLLPILLKKRSNNPPGTPTGGSTPGQPSNTNNMSNYPGPAKPQPIEEKKPKLPF